MLKSVVFGLLLYATFCETYKILVVFPHPGHSHFMVFENLFKELADRGHELTVISHYPLEKPYPNYRDVSLKESSLLLKDIITLDMINGYRYEKWLAAILLRYFSSITLEQGLASENVQKFLQEENHFDLVLGEFFNTNSFLGLAKKYNAPLIAVSSCVAMPWSNDWFGQTDHPAYVPITFMDYSDQKTFVERVESTVLLVLNKLYFRYFMELPGNELAKKYLNVDLLEPEELLYDTSLMLANTHFTLNLPVPLVPNFIEIGGIHIGKANPLPKVCKRYQLGSFFFH